MRYRFETWAQARQHIHLIGRRQLLFFLDPFIDVGDGQPVLLELCFTTSEQTITARGQVHSVERGNLRGAWLELFSSRLFDGMQIAPAAPPRRHRRLPTDIVVRAGRPGRPPSMARLADVSAGGARVLSAGGRWTVSEEIVLTDLAGGPPLRGEVIRARDGDFSVQFQRNDATTRRNAMKLVETVMQRWNEARETRHPLSCGCGRGGALFEPLLPRSASRRVEGM